MAEVIALIVWDVWLVRTGRRPISTRVRHMWHTHPMVMSLAAVVLVAHLTRPDRLASFDPVSVVADRIATVGRR